MSVFRLEEAIELCNWRNKSINGFKKKTKQSIGRLLFDSSNEKTISVSISQLTKGARKKVSAEWIDKIECDLGVDANFLFNQKSKNDKDYLIMLNQKQNKNGRKKN